MSIGEISSEGTTYIEGNNYDSKAGILGGSTVILDVKENVTIGALTLNGEDNSGADSDNYVVYRSNQNIGGIVSADNLYVSGKNLNIEGSTVAVSENALLNVEKINIESKVNDIYRESKSKDEGFLSSKESHTKSYEEQNVEGQFFAGGRTVTKADINIIGSTFVTGEDSYLGGNVTATSRELNSSYYHQEKETGLVSNFDVGAGGISAGAGIQRTEDTININQKTQAMSNVSLGHGTIVDGDKFSLSATNFQHGAIVINSKEVYYGATKNTYDEQTEHKESYVGVSASISSPLLNRIDQAYNGVEATSNGNGTAGLVNGGVSVINSAVGTVNGLAGNKKGLNNDFLISANAGLTASKSESKSRIYYETGVVTVISGLDENSSITYNNTDKITYEGTQSYGDTFIYNNVKEIEKKAVELNNYYSSSSSNTNAFGGMTFDTVTGRPGGANFSISGGNSNYTQEGTSYQNGIFVGVSETYNNVGKMTIDGFEQYGGKVTGNIGELDIKSKQNTSKTDGSSSNYSVGTGFQTIGTANKGAENIRNNAAKGMNGSIGGSQTTGDRSYVDTPSAFLVGEGSDLSIGKVTNTGAVIGTEEGTNSKINIDEYIGKDIKNKDNYNVTGGTIGSGGVGFEYQDKEKEGITHNTVVGNVNIGNSTGDEINRDINNMQETTKDKDSGYYNTFVESGVLALTTEKGRNNFKENIHLSGQYVLESLEDLGIISNKSELSQMQQTYVMKPMPGNLPSGTDLTSYIDSYSGSNSKVIYYDDKSGNIIYAEDISNEQNNYIDADATNKGDYSVRSKFGFLYVDKNDYTGKAKRIYLSSEANHYDMLNNVNVLSTDPINYNNTYRNAEDQYGNKTTIPFTEYGLEYTFILYPVEVYDKENKKKIIVWESTTAYKQGSISGNYNAAQDELQNKKISTPLGLFQDKEYGHSHAGRTSASEERYSGYVNGNSYAGDIGISLNKKIPLSLGTPGCLETGTLQCGIGQPKSWIYYPDINQVKFLGNIQDFNGKVDLTRFSIDKNQNMVPIEFKRDKNGLLIPK